MAAHFTRLVTRAVACGGPELDNVCAVVLRAIDHDRVLARGGHRSRSLAD
jgi:hypothetical protein